MSAIAFAVGAVLAAGLAAWAEQADRRSAPPLVFPAGVGGRPAESDGSPAVDTVITHAAAGLSMDQAVRIAERQFKARVVRAESQQNSGHTVYVLRLLNESGRVWTVRVDASSGTVVDASQGP